jgi:hypothetical protein
LKTKLLSLNVPETLYNNLKLAAAQDQVAMNQCVAIALAEKLSARQTAEVFFSTRPSLADRAKALQMLRNPHANEAEADVVASIKRSA